MKSGCFTVIFCVLVLTGYSQYSKNTLALAVAGSDRMTVVKSSVHLAEWHEKTFWPLYEKYLTDAAKVYAQTYRSLKSLAETAPAAAEADAFENGWNVLTFRNDELLLRRKYYQEVGAVLNGVVALEFIQTEAMMDMMESAQIYSQTGWKRYRFQSQSLPSGEVQKAKHNMMTSALKLTPEKAELFWPVYARYEEECDALLGEAYSVYNLFAVDAADFTPGLAKRLGNELLHVMEREIRLKERYFLEINASVGSTVAARFLAWEDYYSLVSKMNAWADQHK